MKLRIRENEKQDIRQEFTSEYDASKYQRKLIAQGITAWIYPHYNSKTQQATFVVDYYKGLGEKNMIIREINKRPIKEEMFHHIDNGYSMVDISNTKPIDIKGWKLTFDGTLDEMDNRFYFEEDEQGGFGGVQFFGVGNLTKGDENIQFNFWFNVNLYGDEEDETKIYIDIDNSLIDTDLFEYEIVEENTDIPVRRAEDVIFDWTYEIGEAIYDVIQANATGFGYAENGWYK